MMAHDVRPHNLRILVIDDENDPQLRLAEKHIDVVAIDLRAVQTHRLRIARWHAHCQSLFETKEIPFDLLSVDINFRKDIGDPMRRLASLQPGAAKLAADAREAVASGLYHGMMALARRSTHDLGGNRLPLAWEVRTYAPDLYERREDLRCDALRGYALLRSLLATPREGETLASCVARERGEETADPTEDLEKAMERDMTALPPSHGGDGESMLRRLLPLWRGMFLDAVRAHEVCVPLAELSALIARCSERQGIPSKDRPDAWIPIGGRAYRVAGGIYLHSVFADVLTLEGVLPLDAPPAVPTNGSSVAWTARQWLEALGRAVSLEDAQASTRELVALGKSIEWFVQNNVPLQTMWDAVSNRRKGLIYCLLVTKTLADEVECIADDGFSKLVDTDEEIGGFVAISTNERTFLNPVKAACIAGCQTSADLKTRLRAALLGLGDMDGHPDWQWLKEGLREYCEKELEPRARKCVPGLFRPT
jgi:hypothetical protein